MSLFPIIESPCPYKDNLSAIMDGDMCRMCDRQVFELTAMSDAQRKSFLSSCSGEVCVFYKIPVARAVAAAAIASAAMLSVPAVSAQDASDLYCYQDVIIVGGLRKGDDAKMVEIKSDLPHIPVVYETDADLEAFERMFGMSKEKQPDMANSLSAAKSIAPEKVKTAAPLTAKGSRKSKA